MPAQGEWQTRRERVLETNERRVADEEEQRKGRWEARNYLLKVLKHSPKSYDAKHFSALLLSCRKILSP